MKNLNLNESVYTKIVVQAEEAKELGFEKLAKSVLDALPSMARKEKENVVYSSEELVEDIHNKLWKIAMDVIKYHDVTSVDIQKIDDVIIGLTKTVASEIEHAMDAENKIGPLEPKLLGESK